MTTESITVVNALVGTVVLCIYVHCRRTCTRPGSAQDDTMRGSKEYLRDECKESANNILLSPLSVHKQQLNRETRRNSNRTESATLWLLTCLLTVKFHLAEDDCRTFPDIHHGIQFYRNYSQYFPLSTTHKSRLFKSPTMKNFTKKHFRTTAIITVFRLL